MMRVLLLLSLCLSFLLGCEKKDQTSYLWVLALLGSNVSQNGATTPENPGPITDPTTPTMMRITLLDAPSTNEMCPLYGGIFIQYKRGENKTCDVKALSSTCVSFLYNPDGSIKTTDPRSFVGLSFTDDIEIPSHLYPSNSMSHLLCFRQTFPKDNAHVEMYSFQLQSLKTSSNNCSGTWIQNQCIDQFPILGKAKFLMPKEFLIQPSDGDGHAGSHRLLLQFISDDSLYTTCTYFGNEHRKLEGFSENAYIAGNEGSDGTLGTCKQCVLNYCGSTDPNTGLVLENEPVQSYPIPFGNLVTIQKEITLQVVKGQGPGKHTVKWNIEGFHQWIESNQMPIFFSNTNILFVFLFPILLTTLYFLFRFNRKGRDTK